MPIATGRSAAKSTACSITSSASARSFGGMSRPSVLAVLRLMINSNFDGCATGKSDGFSPLRMRHNYPSNDRARRDWLRSWRGRRPRRNRGGHKSLASHAGSLRRRVCRGERGIEGRRRPARAIATAPDRSLARPKVICFLPEDRSAPIARSADGRFNPRVRREHHDTETIGPLRLRRYPLRVQR